MVSTAHEQFKKLRMWPEAVECLIIAERNVEAEDMLKDGAPCGARRKNHGADEGRPGDRKMGILGQPKAHLTSAHSIRYVPWTAEEWGQRSWSFGFDMCPSLPWKVGQVPCPNDCGGDRDGLNRRTWLCL